MPGKFVVYILALGFLLSGNIFAQNQEKIKLPLGKPIIHSFETNFQFHDKTQSIKPFDVANKITYLALGDSYTAGTSVCYKCAFPVQLAYLLNENKSRDVQLTRYAEAGWRTDDLINTLKLKNISSDFDFTTLLIGSNNLYQRKAFSQFKTEFIQLLEFAINHTKNNAEGVFVISIPDYAYTPFGQKENNTKRISKKVNAYNSFIEEVAKQREVFFLDITTIAKRGLSEPTLIAKDGLHLSKKANTEIVNRIKPFIENVLKVKEP
ncbi:lysophospholipase L1-like esterase [Leeuwenhoekiella aestuarii]|uniref:Lysophospholipase L1-like esterase n=1 Tax=Leeuwenhoekiella aestuarii TaxID=2249426 RepID=A0A4V1KPX9_9FLAO|nr:GDSL-type esterase/lipase family protein [Leeuwenhoekiella aestuarii]RXG18252.1 lysophospholipase L1-like esterase [Leeuwenhoekiella aestuarii]RXG19557.1 lysophospholipase L1-like esterase [Leeuwenhoekiella aestuarii]